MESVSDRPCFFFHTHPSRPWASKWPLHTICPVEYNLKLGETVKEICPKSEDTRWNSWPGKKHVLWKILRFVDNQEKNAVFPWKKGFQPEQTKLFELFAQTYLYLGGQVAKRSRVSFSKPYLVQGSADWIPSLPTLSFDWNKEWKGRH